MSRIPQTRRAIAPGCAFAECAARVPCASVRQLRPRTVALFALALLFMETASCRDEPQEHEWEDQRANDLTRVEQLREQRIFTANKQFKSHLSLAEWYVDFGKPAKAIAELEKALQISEATGTGDAKKLIDA